MRLIHFANLLRGNLSRKTNRQQQNITNRGSFEVLESRRLLAIDWVNQATNNFAAIYGAEDGAIATQLVARAVADWEAVSEVDPKNWTA